MRQMKCWGVPARAVAAAFILITFFAVGLALGQTHQAMRIKVPYGFRVGSTALPAGVYTFSADESGLLVNPESGTKFHGTIIARLSGPAQFLRDGSLVFDKTDGGRILSEVWIPGADGLLLHKSTKTQDRDVLSVSQLDQTKTISGRAAYDLTCGKCHGSGGQGDERADEFFNIKIPRLSSAAVQDRSDAELKEIINKGTSAMPPVEIDEAGFRHRLPPQDVDAVITYVRTLKR
jgi:mono/diheme cytochrome c family protein